MLAAMSWKWRSLNAGSLQFAGGFPAEALPLAALKVWRAAFPDEIPRGSPLMSPPAVGVGLYATGQSLEDERAQTLAYVAASRATLSNSRETS
jgi:hypothetical protein